MKQYASLDDTIHLWFASNDTSGSGGDGASAAADVRLAGAAAGAAPVYSPTPTLLTHANYPAGSYEIAITASTANGFATNNTYAVFCTLAIDSQNPTGFVGSFDLKPVESNMEQCGGSAVAAGAIPNAAADAAGGLPVSDAGGLDLDTKLANTNEITAARMGALTDWINGGRLDLLLDAIPTTAMRGTDSAALATTALSTATWTAARAGALTDWINGGRLDNLLDAIPTTAMRGTDNAALATTALTNVTWTDAKAGALADWINGGRLDLIIDLILADTAELQTNQGAWITATGFSTHSAADVKTAIEAAGSHLALILADTGTDGVLIAPTATSPQLVDDMWDEILSGLTHNIAGSAGRRVREIGAYAINSGTAQAGATHSITLAATASAVDGTYNRNLIVITDNTGVGQTRTIVDYNGTTKVAIIDRDWRTSPDATTEYQVTPDNTPLVVDQGVAQGGTATTITLRAYASSANDMYLCNVIAIIAGTGRGQARLVGAYNGTTKVVTICGDDWITNPDTSSVYVLMPYGTTCTSCIGTHALGLINAEVKDCLTIDTIADSYATDGAQPTIAQAILAIHQMLQEKSISGTTLTVKKPDGSTVAMTFTLDSATAPTSITRAT